MIHWNIFCQIRNDRLATDRRLRVLAQRHGAVHTLGLRLAVLLHSDVVVHVAGIQRTVRGLLGLQAGVLLPLLHNQVQRVTLAVRALDDDTVGVGRHNGDTVALQGFDQHQDRELSCQRCADHELWRIQRAVFVGGFSEGEFKQS